MGSAHFVPRTLVDSNNVISDHEIHPESIGIISVSDLTEVKNQQPFIVAFFKYGATSQNKKIRRIRDTPSGKRKQAVSNNVNPFASK